MLCVASHDAGGAEVLASYVARKNIACSFVLDGPARQVFERRLGRAVQSIPLGQALESCERFLVGTSWQSDLEWQVIRGARRSGKPVTAFLDHWGHYRERFVRGGLECLPDRIWVGDAEAADMARELFPAVPVEQLENPYFADVRETIARLEAARPGHAGRGLRILFVCEPMSEHGLKEFGDALHWGYTEFDALRYFCANLHLLGQPVERLVIRPHPSEARDKYDAIARELGHFVQPGGRQSLFEEIADCDLVAGCESMAMVVGLIAGRRVVSAVPPGGLPCSLPHKDIESMQNMQASVRAQA